MRIEAPMIEPDEVLAISGEGKELGNWDPAHALVLNDASFPVWEINLSADSMATPFEYKFIILKERYPRGEGLGIYQQPCIWNQM